MSLLSVAALSKSYGGVRAVDNVSFALERGEMVALIGPNGAGKSTVFGMIGGQIRPDSGQIFIDGRISDQASPQWLWQMGVGRTFQIAQSFGSMSVLENVQMALIAAHHRVLEVNSIAATLYQNEAQALLAQVNMSEHSARACHTLAYGDVKRLELALALASRPNLLLMDEPMAGMGAREREVLMQVLRDIVAARNIGVLFTEHDMGAVFSAADRIIVLAEGRIIASAAPQQVAADAQVRRLYLGHNFSFDAHHTASGAHP